jgi:hypothetical protein
VVGRRLRADKNRVWFVSLGTAAKAKLLCCVASSVVRAAVSSGSSFGGR